MQRGWRVLAAAGAVGVIGLGGVQATGATPQRHAARTARRRGATTAPQVSAVSALPVRASVGQAVAVSVQVRHAGGRRLSVSVLLSRTARRTRSALPMGRVVVPLRRGSGRAVGRLAVPSRARTGAYRLLACAGRRCTAARGRFTVISPGAGGASSPVPEPAPPAALSPPAPGPGTPAPPADGGSAPSGGGGPPPPPAVVFNPVTTPAPAPGPSDAPAPRAAAVAPPVTPSGAASVADSIRFLTTGSDPIQPGVAAGTITPRFGSLVQGAVVARDGGPVGGVRISVLGHPELGHTDTATDGSYALAVNGGTTLTLQYRRAGYLPVDRTVDVPSQGGLRVDDVALVAAAADGALVDLTAPDPIQVARSGPESDASGQRQATLLFRQGTTATMTLPDGSQRTLDQLHVRATEYTVGPQGEAAMPGTLPPTSAYTYATDFSADEATAAGATALTFSQPVIAYTEDIVGFPVGASVPSGALDPATGQWHAAAPGVVIEVLGVDAAGNAQVDADGDGQPDSADALAARGIDAHELAALGQLYSPGTKLWRVPVAHFSSWDFNWVRGVKVPHAPPNAHLYFRYPDDPCATLSGSSVLCGTRAVAEDVPVAGTPYQLHYQSDREPGYTPARTIRIPVVGADPLPDSVVEIDTDVDVLGRDVHHAYCVTSPGCEPGATPLPPGTTNRVDTFTWDGRDGFGRPYPGAVQAQVRVTYALRATYQWSTSADTFGQPGVRNDGPADNRSFVRGSVVSVVPLEGDRPAATSIGGWDLDVHATYDPVSRRITYGDGTEASATSVATALSPVAGEGAAPLDGPAPARSVKLAPTAVIATPDGGEDISSCGSGTTYVVHVGPDGMARRIAGTGASGDGGDGGPATSATFGCPSALALSPGGSLYVVDLTQRRVRVVRPDGTIAAVDVPGLLVPDAVAAGPDGSVWITDTAAQDHLYRIDPGGAPGIVRLPRSSFASAAGIAVTAAGDAIVSDAGRSELLRVTPDGTVTTIAGTGRPGSGGDGGAATTAELSRPAGVAIAPDGAILVADSGNASIRRITPDGTITTVAGGGGTVVRDQPLPAFSAMLPDVQSVAADDRGDLLVTDADHIDRLASVLPEAGLTSYAIPSSDGQTLRRFDAAGNETAELDALTGATRRTFAYDAAGRLTSVTDGYGNTTTIQRDGSGAPTAIVAPGGQVTQLQTDADGDLAGVTSPRGGHYTMTYAPGTLLTSLRDPDGGTSHQAYDGLGLLTSDTDANGAQTTVDGTDTPSSITVHVGLPGGGTATYHDELQSTGVLERTATIPGAGTTTARLAADGSSDLTLPDGTHEQASLGADPRFGLLAPVISHFIRTTPGHGGDLDLSEARTVSLGDPANLLSVTDATDTISDAIIQKSGAPAVTTTHYQAAGGTRTLTETSPEGRTVVTTLDAHGAPVRIAPGGGRTPTTITRDAHGMITQVATGAEHTTLTYDAARQLATSADATGATTTFHHDADGNVSSVDLPGGGQELLTHSLAGDLTSLTSPSGAVHRLTYDAVHEQTAYTPPGAGAFTSTYDAGRRLSAIGLPGGVTLTIGRDAAGRPTTMTTPEGVTTTAYAAGDPTGRPASESFTPTGGGAAEALVPTYDGPLLSALDVRHGTSTVATTTTGHVAGRSTGFQLSIGGTSVLDQRVARDADGAVTAIGPFTVTPDAASGLPDRIDDGNGFTVDVARDGQDRPATRTASEHGAAVASEALTRDAAGRIVQRDDTVGATHHVDTYAYDAAGRLTAVTEDGAPVEAYAYDADGNRTSSQTGVAPAQGATYDAQGRLTMLGTTPYGYDAAGDLVSRGADTFTHDARGELTGATIGGTHVTYGNDPLGRRVTRTVGGATTRYVYGNPDDLYQLSAVIAPGGAVTTYQYDAEGLLAGVTTPTATYRVFSDALGSPRVVYDEGTGAVVKQLRYDAYGDVTQDTDPALHLDVGFAGGLDDSLTGLVRFGERDYEPAAGRFVTRDPSYLDGGPNLYAYADDDPVDFIDPTGLDTVAPDGRVVHTPTQQPGESLDHFESRTLDYFNCLAAHPVPEDQGLLSKMAEKARKAWDKERDKLADEWWNVNHAIHEFVEGDGPRSAVDAAHVGLQEVGDHEPIPLVPTEAADQALDKGVDAIDTGVHAVNRAINESDRQP